MKDHKYLSPSLLSADFGDLKGALKLVEEKGSSYVHVDVMDGKFVKNKAFLFEWTDILFLR